LHCLFQLAEDFRDLRLAFAGRSVQRLRQHRIIPGAPREGARRALGVMTRLSPPTRLLQMVMAGKTIVLRELRPQRSLSLCPVRQQPQRRLSRNDLPESPGAGFEVGPSILLLLTPVLGHDRVKGTELKIQARMAGGNQI